MTYLVMETKTSYCIVLDNDGRFIKAANFGYHVGETLPSIYPMEPDNSKGRGQVIRLLSAVAAIAAVLVFVVAGLWQQGRTVYGSIYFTVNPQVHIEVNKKEKVLGLYGENAEGVQFLEGYDYKGNDVYQVTQDLIGRALDEGYLTQDGTVTLAIASEDTQWEQTLGIALREQAITPQAQEHNVTLRIVAHDETSPSTAKGSVAERTERPSPKVSSESSVAESPVAESPVTENTVPKNVAPKESIAPSEAQQEEQSSSQSEPPSSSSQPPAVSSQAEKRAESSPEVSLAQAKSIALRHAKVSADSAVFTKEELDTEDGLLVFELAFHTNTHRYFYEIVQANGQVHSAKVKEREALSHPESDTLSPEQAVTIAITHAGARRSEIHDVDVDFDREDNIYEVEFDWEGSEYEYEIHGTTGEIITYEVDD